MTGRHDSSCLIPRDALPPAPSLSLLSLLFSSSSFHPSITSSRSPPFPSIPFFWLSPLTFHRGAVSITQPVSSRDRIWVIGAGARVFVCVCGWRMGPSRQTELPFPLPPNEVWLVSGGELDGQLQLPSPDTRLPVTLDLLPSALLYQSIAVRDPSLSRKSTVSWPEQVVYRTDHTNKTLP